MPIPRTSAKSAVLLANSNIFCCCGFAKAVRTLNDASHSFVKAVPLGIVAFFMYVKGTTGKDMKGNDGE